MAAYKRALIGSSFGTGEETVAFLSNRNFHELNIVVWMPTTVTKEMDSHGQQPYPKAAVAALERRLAHLAEWVAQGHTLILVRHGPVPYRFKQAGASSYSALERHAPLDGIEFSIAAGTRVEYCGPASAADVFKKHLPKLRYDAVLAGEGLVPLLRVARGSPGPTQIVGGYRRYWQGLIIYLPSVDGGAVEWAPYINDVSELQNALTSAPSALPKWIDQYQTAEDVKAFAQIAELTRQTSELQVQLDKQHAVIQASRDLKPLVFDTGTAFADAVSTALTELGLSVVEGPHPRADLLASNGTRFGAIEAKVSRGRPRKRTSDKRSNGLRR